MSKEKYKQKTDKIRAIIITILVIILIGSIGYLTYHFYQQWSQKQEIDNVVNDIENAIEDVKNETEFDNYIKNIKKLSMYKIEDTATYGDQLITLSTCDYHVEDGRFAVVAKKVD